MTEDEYQETIRALGNEMKARAGVLADFLVSQPRRGEALSEAVAFGWWCVTEGARQADAAIERERRKHLARHGAA